MCNMMIPILFPVLHDHDEKKEQTWGSFAKPKVHQPVPFA